MGGRVTAAVVKGGMIVRGVRLVTSEGSAGPGDRKCAFMTR